MTKENNEAFKNDDIDILVYFKQIMKRKKILWGVVIFTTLVTSIVNVLLPKIYKGEYIIRMETTDFSDLVPLFNSDEKYRLKNYLPNTIIYLSSLKIENLEDPVAHKIKVSIESTDSTKIDLIEKELLSYITNFPYYKRSVDEEKISLEKQLEELISTIQTSEHVLKTYNLLMESANLRPIAFNPIELYSGILNLKKSKMSIEQKLKFYSGSEVITKDILKRPVRPKILINVILSMFISFFAGLALIIMLEFIEKIKIGEPKL